MKDGVLKNLVPELEEVKKGNIFIRIFNQRSLSDPIPAQTSEKIWAQAINSIYDSLLLGCWAAARVDPVEAAKPKTREPCIRSFSTLARAGTCLCKSAKVCCAKFK